MTGTVELDCIMNVRMCNVNASFSCNPFSFVYVCDVVALVQKRFSDNLRENVAAIISPVCGIHSCTTRNTTRFSSRTILLERVTDAHIRYGRVFEFVVRKRLQKTVGTT